MVSLNELIAKHRQKVLEKEKKQTEKAFAKLKNESAKTERYAKYQYALKKQKLEQEKAMKLQKKLSAIRNKSRNEKIQGLKAFALKAGSSIAKTAKTMAKNLEENERRDAEAAKRRRRKTPVKRRAAVRKKIR